MSTNEYFWPLERRDAFRAILETWVGTPYLHMGTQKKSESGGGGVDCTKFIGLALIELGVLNQLKPREYYPKDWYLHGDVEVVLDSLQYHIDHYLNPGFSVIRYDTWSELPVPDPLFGDVVTFYLNKKELTNHTAFYLGGYPGEQMLHCIQKLGICICTFSPAWKAKMRYFYRLYEETA